MNSPLSTRVTVGANVEVLTKIAMRKTTAETSLPRCEISSHWKVAHRIE